MNKRMESLKKEAKELQGIIESLDKFDGVEVNDTTRKQLKECLSKITKFNRVDVDKTITLRLGNFPAELAEVVVIYSSNNKIRVNCDRLWKTVFGLKEQVEEMRAYEMD